MGLTYHDEILVDNQKAHSYAMQYLAIVLHNMNAQGLILTSAMLKFTKFLDLPESKSGSWWELAVNVIGTVVPAFKWMRMLSEQEQAVEKAAIEIAAALGSKRAKAVKLVERGKEIKEKIDSVKDPAMKVKENLETLAKSPPSGLSELSKLDSTKKPIRELIEASKKALLVWAKTLNTLDLELENRLSDLNTRAKETMLAMVQRLLKLPDFPKDEELDQIETACLWKMIGDWVSKNVYWLETTTMIHQMGATSDRMIRGRTEKTLEGINNTQVQTIVLLFGPHVPRGKYFNAPMIFYLWQALEIWGTAPTQSRTEYVHQVTVSGKM